MVGRVIGSTEISKIGVGLIIVKKVDDIMEMVVLLIHWESLNSLVPFKIPTVSLGNAAMNSVGILGAVSRLTGSETLIDVVSSVALLDEFGVERASKSGKDKVGIEVA